MGQKVTFKYKDDHGVATVAPMIEQLRTTETFSKIENLAVQNGYSEIDVYTIQKSTLEPGAAVLSKNGVATILITTSEVFYAESFDPGVYNNPSFGSRAFIPTFSRPIPQSEILTHELSHFALDHHNDGAIDLFFGGRMLNEKEAIDLTNELREELGLPLRIRHELDPRKADGYYPFDPEAEFPLPGSITNIRDMSSQNGDVGSMRPEFEWDAVKNQIGMKVFDRNDPNKVLAYVQNDGVVYKTPEDHYYTENMLDHYGQKKNHSDGSHSITTSFGGTFRALGDALGFDGEFGIQGTFAKKDGSEGKDSAPTDAKPIILDLDGDGVEIEVNGDVSFDMDADGYLETTAWASADDGFLVVDLNADGTRGAGDGKIDQTKELVLTEFAESDLVTDLQALSFFDQFAEWGGNQDGVLDAGDTVWAELKVWQDLNQNGVSDAGELKTLDEWGISSINLTYDDGTEFEDTSNDVTIFGSTLVGSASYTKTDGSVVTGGVGDVALGHSGAGYRRVDTSNGYQIEFETGETLRYQIMDGTGSTDVNLVTHWLDGVTGDVRDNLLDGTGHTHDLQIAGDADTLAGGNDTLIGGYGNDMLSGGLGADELSGNQGNDVLFFDDADTVVDGGSGRDHGIYTGATAINRDLSALNLEGLSAGAGDDTLTGGAQMTAVAISGGAGDDDISGGLGENNLSGEDGNDTITGGASADYLSGGADNDSLSGGDGDDLLSGGHGQDSLYAGADDDTVLGGDGDDFVSAGTGDDYVSGGDGNDILHGNQKSDTVNGGNGDDSLNGDEGSDVLRGDGGVDQIWGGSGDDELFGGSDNDSLYGGTGDDELTGQGGDDELLGQDGDDIITGEWGNDTLIGSDGDDSIRGGDGDDSINGGSGDDFIMSDAGNDTIIGGAGDDTIEGNAGRDSIEGGAGDDTILGGADHDTIHGGSGDNYLRGGDGNDRLYGGTDRNRLDGGDGDDRLYIGTSDYGYNWAMGGVGYDTVVLQGVKSDWTYWEVNPGANDGIYHFQLKWGDKQVHSVAVEVVEFSDGARYPLTDADENDINRPDRLGSLYADNTSATSINGKIWGSARVDDFTYSGNQDVYTHAGNDIVRLWSTANYVNVGSGDDTIAGSTSNDTLRGGSGQDEIYGGSGADTLLGSEGNDKLWGGDESDRIKGESGDDLVVGEMGADNLSGNEGDDIIFGDDVGIDDNGTPDDTNDDSFVTGNSQWGNDTITGDGGNDRIYAGRGSDLVHGGAGHDYVEGNASDDTLNGNDGHDWLDGGAQNDELDGGTGDDTLLGGDGNDRMWGRDGADHAAGGAGHDLLSGDSGADILSGDAGQDTIYGDSGADRLFGGDGDDSIWGGHGDDSINGDDGDDELRGDLGDDVIDGGNGHDQLWGWAGHDALRGGNGNDSLNGEYGNDQLDGQMGNDVLTGGFGFDLLLGGEGNDTLSGNEDDDHLRGQAGDDSLHGGDGNDLLQGGDGADQINGGTGIDTASFVQSSSGVAVDLQLSTASGGAAAGDILISIENITGSAHDDVLNGDATPNALSGEAGADHIRGRSGNDWLEGGAGDDMLNGGAGIDYLQGDAGADTFSFQIGDGTDTVADFEDEIDLIEMTGGLTFADLTLTSDATLGEVYVTYGTSDQITIKIDDVTLIDQNDFSFV